MKFSFLNFVRPRGTGRGFDKRSRHKHQRYAQARSCDRASAFCLRFHALGDNQFYNSLGRGTRMRFSISGLLLNLRPRVNYFYLFCSRPTPWDTGDRASSRYLLLADAFSSRGQGVVRQRITKVYVQLLRDNLCKNYPI